MLGYSEQVLRKTFDDSRILKHAVGTQIIIRVIFRYQCIMFHAPCKASTYQGRSAGLTETRVNDVKFSKQNKKRLVLGFSLQHVQTISPDLSAFSSAVRLIFPDLDYPITRWEVRTLSPIHVRSAVTPCPNQ